MNYTRRHSYYVRRTLKWLELYGYTARKVESNYTAIRGDSKVYVKEDLWGADVLARSAERGLHFIQVKTSAAQLHKGLKQLQKDENWPIGIGRFVVFWDKGTRLADGPHIVSVPTTSGSYPICSFPGPKTQGD